MPTDVVAVLLGMRHARSAAQLLLRLRTAGLAHYKNSETWAIGRIESDSTVDTHTRRTDDRLHARTDATTRNA